MRAFAALVAEVNFGYKRTKSVSSLWRFRADIPDSYIQEVKEMLLNYNGPKNQKVAHEFKTTEAKIFEDSKTLERYLRNAGFNEFKIPIIDQGIYYDDGLTIKKIEAGWETNIVSKIG